jgi:hypothetical protein
LLEYENICSGGIVWNSVLLDDNGKQGDCHPVLTNINTGSHMMDNAIESRP